MKYRNFLKKSFRLKKDLVLGFTIPLLPDSVYVLYNNRYIVVLRVIGGLSALCCLFGLNLDIIFFNYLIKVMFILQVWQLFIISVFKVIYTLLEINKKQITYYYNKQLIFLIIVIRIIFIIFGEIIGLTGVVFFEIFMQLDDMIKSLRYGIKKKIKQ